MCIPTRNMISVHPYGEIKAIFGIVCVHDKPVETKENHLTCCPMNWNIESHCTMKTYLKGL